MPSIPFSLNTFKRDLGNLPEWKLINFFAEAAPTADKGTVLQSRGGLVLNTTVGAGPIRGLFSQPGTYGGAIFTVSGTQIYRDSTLLGTLAGAGPVSIAASGTEVVFAAGSTARSYNGTNIADIVFPDTASVTAVGYVSQLFVFLRAGTGRFYWSAINDARTIDALDFANAEMDPDNLLDIQRYRGNMWLLGNSSGEPWFPTADADLPFSRINQDVYDVGVFTTGCAAVFDNALHFIGSDGVVYRGEEVPRRISDHGIEERIAEAGDVSAFAFEFEKHKFFTVCLDTGTFLFDVSTGLWTCFESYGLDRWRVSCAASVGRETVFGDYSNGKLWEMDSTVMQDDGGTLEGYLTAGLPLKAGTEHADSFEVETNPGRVTDPAADPVVEMRFSRNAGATWSPWLSARLGTMGEYRARARWRRLGVFDPPGAMFHIRFTDNVPRRVSDVLLNEPAGGRSRAV
jgi:hypothetical protein